MFGLTCVPAYYWSINSNWWKQSTYTPLSVCLLIFKSPIGAANNCFTFVSCFVLIMFNYNFRWKKKLESRGSLVCWRKGHSRRPFTVVTIWFHKKWWKEHLKIWKSEQENRGVPVDCFNHWEQDWKQLTNHRHGNNQSKHPYKKVGLCEGKALWRKKITTVLIFMIFNVSNVKYTKCG